MLADLTIHNKPNLQHPTMSATEIVDLSLGQALSKICGNIETLLYILAGSLQAKV